MTKYVGLTFVFVFVFLSSPQTAVAGKFSKVKSYSYRDGFHCDPELFDFKGETDQKEYILESLNRNARPLVYQTFKYIPLPKNEEHKQVLDLGAGGGSITHLLLTRGFYVDALDIDPFSLYAIEHCTNQYDAFLGTKSPKKISSQLKTILSSMEDMQLNENHYDFVTANLSLPFAKKSELSNILKKVFTSMKEGAVFSGDFFGENHAWKKNKDVNGFTSFYTEKQIKKILKKAGFEILSFSENSSVAKNTTFGASYFHKYAFIATKKSIWGNMKDLKKQKR